jgi:hypothetical protein
MPIVDLTGTPVPNDDEDADAIDVAGPINAILAVLNGHIDGDNIEPGSLPWSVMAAIVGSIGATSLTDEASLLKYRDELNTNFVASGLVWSAISGLNGTMTSGVLYSADGSRTAISAVTSRAFTASKDTYVDVTAAGSISYNEVTNGAASPALTAGSTRLAKVVSDGSAITAVTTSGPDSLLNIIRPTVFIPTGLITTDQIASVIQTASVATSQTTTSSSYTDLSTSGPAVTVTVPRSGIVQLSEACTASNSVVNDASVMSYVASGANTISGSDASACFHRAHTASNASRSGFVKVITGLTPGSTTFKAVYRSSGGTATFSGRDISVEPKP